ncbi:helix-turn-helix domain-containing protein, partial [Dermacoccus nishinomiyaensis]
MSSYVPAAEHVLALLQRIAARPSPAPAAALARELDLPRSSVYK